MKENEKQTDPPWLIISVAILVFIILMMRPVRTNLFVWLGESLTKLLG